MARHDRLTGLAELRRVIKTVERQGVSHQPAPVLVGLIDARLAKGADGRSARLVALLAGLQDKSNDRAPGMEAVACGRDCHYCCDVYVSA